MTYEVFKLCVLYLATQPEQGMPNVLASIRKAMSETDKRATADEILAIAYADYCLTHGITDSAPAKPLVSVKEIDDICTELNWLADVTDDGLRHNKDTADTLRQAAKLIQTTIMKQP